MKRKLLIVNNNLMVGGIQKSLINLLNSLCDIFDITLFLFSDYGELLCDIPKGIHVIYGHKKLNVLGVPVKEMKHSFILMYYKILSKIILKVLGKKMALKYIFSKQKTLDGFDCVISYSQCMNSNALTICTAEFVLDKTICSNKICFVHCDYKESNTADEYSMNIYRQFDKIACCSDSVRKKFLEVIPDISNKTFTVRNFVDLSIGLKANEEVVEYDPSFINIITVARLSEEKGVLDAIKVLSAIENVRYYVIGDGPEKDVILKFLIEHKLLNNKVYLLGEKINPYPFMKGADYLLVPSKYEAAPIVFDEANALGLRIISTDTTSAKEMLGQEDFVISSLDEFAKINLEKVSKKDSQSRTAGLSFEQFSKLVIED